MTRTQRYLLFAAIAIGAMLRFEGAHTQSLSHYDEGVYVHNGIAAAFGEPFRFNFDLPLHAPPLFPWAVGAVCWLINTPWPHAGIFVAALFGVATIPLVFLVARRIAGVEGGLLAAFLLSTSDLHVAFSRMALTDVPVTFWFVLATYLAIRMDESLRDAGDRINPPSSIAPLIWAAAVGCTSAIAWNTKYNGWMPLAVGIAAAVFCLVITKRSTAEHKLIEGPRTRRTVMLLFVAALLAAAGYAPWYFFVNSNFDGGYAAVTAHHATYLGGPSAWPENAWRHTLALGAYRHYGWILAGLAAIVVGIGRVFRGPGVGTFGSDLLRPAGTLLSVGACFVAGLDLLMILVAIVAVLPCLKSRRFIDVLLAAWVVAFVVLIPLYYPYSRLLVPLVPFAACLSSRIIVQFFGGRSDDDQIPSRAVPIGPAVAVTVCLLIGVTSNPFGILPSVGVWQRWSARESYRGVEAAVAATTEVDALVICQAQPTLALYVPRERVPIGNVPFTNLSERIPPGRPTYLAVDFFWLHSQPDPDALQGLLAAFDRLELIAMVDNDLGIVTLGDFLTPQQVASKLAASPRLPDSGEDVIPPALEAEQHDFIAIYAIRRD